MELMPPHPGQIKMIEEFDGATRMVNASEVPETHRFMFLDAKGQETDPQAAVSRIPIVVVKMFSTDGQGNLVPKKRAKQLRVLEFGPDGQVLRSTVLVPN